MVLVDWMIKEDSSKLKEKALGPTYLRLASSDVAYESVYEGREPNAERLYIGLN